MTVYVDNFRVPARVGRVNGRWSHLSADTVDELHTFADRLGLQRSWFQERCKTRCTREGVPCPHWHYDVVEWRRQRAIQLGAVPIGIRDMGEFIGARRRGEVWTGTKARVS